MNDLDAADKQARFMADPLAAQALFKSFADADAYHAKVRAPLEARIAELESALWAINDLAVRLRDEIGTGSAVAELRARVHEMVDRARKAAAGQ